MLYYFICVDENGDFVKRTPSEYPYSYDGHVIAGDVTGMKGDDTVYTDRLLQWNRKKHDNLCKKHFGDEGQDWRDRHMDKVQDFLRDWNDNPKLEVIRVMQYCNASNGYPLWRIDYKHNK